MLIHDNANLEIKYFQIAMAFFVVIESIEPTQYSCKIVTHIEDPLPHNTMIC